MARVKWREVERKKRRAREIPRTTRVKLVGFGRCRVNERRVRDIVMK